MHNSIKCLWKSISDIKILKLTDEWKFCSLESICVTSWDIHLFSLTPDSLVSRKNESYWIFFITVYNKLANWKWGATGMIMRHNEGKKGQEEVKMRYTISWFDCRLYGKTRCKMCQEWSELNSKETPPISSIHLCT